MDATPGRYAAVDREVKVAFPATIQLYVNGLIDLVYTGEVEPPGGVIRRVLLQKFLGGGAFATAWKAVDLDTRRELALKVFQSLGADDDFMPRVRARNAHQK